MYIFFSLNNPWWKPLTEGVVVGVILANSWMVPSRSGGSTYDVDVLSLCGNRDVNSSNLEGPMI